MISKKMISKKMISKNKLYLVLKKEISICEKMEIWIS